MSFSSMISNTGYDPFPRGRLEGGNGLVIIDGDGRWERKSARMANRVYRTVFPDSDRGAYPSVQGRVGIFHSQRKSKGPVGRGILKTYLKMTGYIHRHFDFVMRPACIIDIQNGIGIYLLPRKEKRPVNMPGRCISIDIRGGRYRRGFAGG